MSFVLHLPYPPSVNDANHFGKNKRTGRAQHYPDKDKTAFFREADGLFLQQKRALNGLRVEGPFTYHLILNRGHRHPLADGDNRCKYPLDFLQRVNLIDNDKLAEGGSWSWGSCEFGAMLSVYPVNHRVPQTTNKENADHERADSRA